MDIIFDGENETSGDTFYSFHRTRVALIVLRQRDWVFPSRDQVRRFKVVLKESFADNGNRFKTDQEIEELDELLDHERATMAALSSA